MHFGSKNYTFAIHSSAKEFDTELRDFLYKKNIKVCKLRKNSLSLRQMHRHLLILVCSLILSVAARAESEQPVIEIKADRTIIYPQRMELQGEESLMDVLQMVPDLMIAGYEDVIINYNLRIDNCPMNGDTRLILSQMKAKDIAKIQVCDNTGVAKGTIGMGRVLDINMKTPEGVQGFVEAQGDFGKNTEGIGSANVLYGSKSTDIYANTSYRHHDGNEEYLTFHMTNRFDDRNKLLTYFTQQFLDLPSGTSRKILGRARYFHTFNDIGTELLIVGGYQYASDMDYTKKLPLYIVELNTPLITKRLSMMLGAEGDFIMASQKDMDRSWNYFNNDVYLQFTYTLPQWRFTVGNRVMFYNYNIKEGGTSERHADIRDNANATIVFQPDNRNQIQMGFYRKFYDPIDILQEEQTINQMKLAYAYSKQKLTVQTEASYYIIDDDENFAELGASAYWKTKWLSISGGANLYIAKSGTEASLRCAPKAYLPHDWQIGLQVVYYTKNAPIRQLYGTPIYGCLSVNKQLGKRWNLGIDWHDMFDAVCSQAEVNRHAANIKLQYRFE